MRYLFRWLWSYPEIKYPLSTLFVVLVLVNFKFEDLAGNTLVILSLVALISSIILLAIATVSYFIHKFGKNDKIRHVHSAAYYIGLACIIITIVITQFFID